MTFEIETTTVAEIVELAARDSELFCTTFFPETYRQVGAPFHLQVWDLLEEPTHRRVALKMFRGSAKTTLLRTYVAKRIAYGISRTILFTSASQSHAIKSIIWLRKQIERQGLFAQTFGLTPGAKWTDEWIEVQHAVLGITINILAVGITGQTRGINIDDFRPDLIVADDPCDDENSATAEQRQKVSERFFGALERSLAPETENPDAKIVLLQTPFNDEDLITVCCGDQQWASREYSCFDPDGESTWPTRFPTETLRAEKASHALRGTLPVWLREMEVVIVGSGMLDFRLENLKYWSLMEPDARIPCFMYIDPAPPPSAVQERQGMHGKDYECLAVLGVYKGVFILLDLACNRGHQPDWTVAKFFELQARWRPINTRVEAVNYQRTLKWILEKEMNERRQIYAIEAHVDRRGKRHRITQALTSITTQHRLYVHTSHTMFIDQFGKYPAVQHDDALDAVSGAADMAVMYLGGAQEIERQASAGVLSMVSDPNSEWRAAP